MLLVFHSSQLSLAQAVKLCVPMTHPLVVRQSVSSLACMLVNLTEAFSDQVC